MFSMATIAAVGAHDRVNDVVALLQAELDELLQEKEKIRLRMRNLRRRLASSNPRKAARGQSRKLRNIARHAEGRKVRHLHDELSRACRIAFLELRAAATPEDLYHAIVRRGSFSFALIKENPIALIKRTLISMAESGEVICCSASDWAYRAVPRPFQ